MELTGGQALGQQLVKEGVKNMFAIPGAQLDWAMDGLMEVSNQLALRVPRHEQATSYMADGYARTTGQPGVCMVVPGPGLFNAMAGLSTAYACSSPVLCIAGQIPSDTIGKRWGLLHEVKNQSETLASVTKWSALATHPAQIPGLIREAFRQMTTGQPRPVGVEIPPDILQAKADIELVDPVASNQMVPDGASIAAAVKLLRGARFPLIWAGTGVIANNASAALAKLAERLNAPVAISQNGRGALSNRHPLALTSLGARAVLPHADVILVVGSRFMTGGTAAKSIWSNPRAKYIYLNIDPHEFTYPRIPGTNLLGDARVGLEALTSALGSGAGQGAGAAACQKVRDWCETQLAQIEPQYSLVKAMRRALPDNGIYITEITQLGFYSEVAFPVYEPRTYIGAGYQGTLGFGFATGLGAALANPDRPVLAISGDGGFGWNLQELATAGKYGIPLTTVVFRDGAFGNVRRIQKNLFGRGQGTDLHNPDLVKLAEAFGVRGVRVGSVDELEGVIHEAATAQVRAPLLIDMPITEVPSGWHFLSDMPPPKPVAPNPLGESPAM